MTVEQRFAEMRPRLLRLAYSELGDFSEAEDVVQEAWLRLERTGPDSICDLDGWMTVVVARLALDALRSARARRETYVGPWLPEPLLTAPDVAEDVELADSLSTAMLLDWLAGRHDDVEEQGVRAEIITGRAGVAKPVQRLVRRIVAAEIGRCEQIGGDVVERDVVIDVVRPVRRELNCLGGEAVRRIGIDRVRIRFVAGPVLRHAIARQAPELLQIRRRQ